MPWAVDALEASGIIGHQQSTRYQQNCQLMQNSLAPGKPDAEQRPSHKSCLSEVLASDFHSAPKTLSNIN